jgi:serine/threonine protein kinase
MLMLRHPGVVRLEEVLEDEQRIFFVMELCGGGCLAEHCVHPLNEKVARFYFAQFLEAVAYCHSQVLGRCIQPLMWLWSVPVPCVCF